MSDLPNLSGVHAQLRDAKARLRKELIAVVTDWQKQTGLYVETIEVETVLVGTFEVPNARSVERVVVSLSL